MPQRTQHAHYSDKTHIHQDGCALAEAEYPFYETNILKSDVRMCLYIGDATVEQSGVTACKEPCTVGSLNLVPIARMSRRREYLSRCPTAGNMFVYPGNARLGALLVLSKQHAWCKVESCVQRNVKTPTDGTLNIRTYEPKGQRQRYATVCLDVIC